MNPGKRKARTLTRKERERSGKKVRMDVADVKSVLGEQKDLLRPVVQWRRAESALARRYPPSARRPVSPSYALAWRLRWPVVTLRIR